MKGAYMGPSDLLQPLSYSPGEPGLSEGSPGPATGLDSRRFDQ